MDKCVKFSANMRQFLQIINISACTTPKNQLIDIKLPRFYFPGEYLH